MATSAEAVRRGLQLVIGAAVADATNLLRVEPSQAAVLATVPTLTSYYVSGSSALALDWYEDLREEVDPVRAFTPAQPAWQPERFGNALAWATNPLTLDEPAPAEAARRLSVVVDAEVQAGFTDAITDNTRRDPAAVGWKRIARSGACPFCRMLADRGAVYREATANFSAHTGGPKGGGPCHCTAAPVFEGGDVGPEASVEQYRASRRRTTEKDRERLRDYLKANYGA